MEKRPTQLFRFSAEYRTPSGRKTYVDGVARGRLFGENTTLEREARINAAVEICANSRRKVARGLDGIVVTRLEPIGPVEMCPFG